MELLLPSNPIIQQRVHTKSISSLYNHLVDCATNFNIATGFISNDSIAALKQIVEYRNGELNLSLFIGMNYLEGFTKPQYDALRDLDAFLSGNNIGSVLISSQALYHGKMYSFMQGNSCLASFVGSSNLGSFVGTSQNLIEADVLFQNKEGEKINSYIHQITETLGTELKDIPKIEEFKEVDIELLKGYSYVKKLTITQLKNELSKATGQYVDIPLKTEAKSNLNAYFGKGKVKGKYSPRGWYEVELILGKNLPNVDLIPNKTMGTFVVLTHDGYEFECSRQGDYSKNFRSEHDLKILGRWIKGQMENSGALKIGTPVTEETLRMFKKNCLRLTKTTNNKFILSLEYVPE